MTSSRPGYRDETSNSVLSKTAEQTNCDRIAKVPSRNSISSTFRKLVKRRLAWSFAGAAGAPGRQVFPREVGRRGTTSRNWEEARAANVFEMPPPWSNFRVLSRIRLRERDPPQFRKVTFFPARCSSPLSPLPRSRTIPNTRHAAVSVPSGDSFQRDSSESCGRTPSRQRKLPGKNRWLEWRELCQKNKISREGGGRLSRNTRFRANAPLCDQFAHRSCVHLLFVRLVCGIQSSHSSLSFANYDTHVLDPQNRELRSFARKTCHVR